tara:strand:- start:394 stop:1290 length:897 start_codon:yes stop_codon:yes gene_type:complete
MNMFLSFWHTLKPWVNPLKFTQAFLASIVLGLISFLPPRSASNIGSALACTLGPLLHWHKRGMSNLLYIYPDMPEKERQKLMHGVWDNLGRTMGEFACIKKLGPKITVIGLEHLPPAGTPIIFVTAHIANWEALSWFSNLCGRQVMDVYRKPNNVYFDKLLKLRSYGLPVKFIEKNERSGINILRELRSGGAVNLFVDQKGSNGDYLLPFLGKNALTIRAPALLSAKTGAIVIPGRMIRKNNHELQIKLYSPLSKIETSDPGSEQKFMEEINTIVSGWIEETPEQWLWIHRRWKNATN